MDCKFALLLWLPDIITATLIRHNRIPPRFELSQDAPLKLHKSATKPSI